MLNSRTWSLFPKIPDGGSPGIQFLETQGKYDPDAAEKVRRYHSRPEEELYFIDEDYHEWNNLADNPDYADIKRRLRKALVAWMEKVGDKGQQSEIEADLRHGSKAPK